MTTHKPRSGQSIDANLCHHSAHISPNHLAITLPRKKANGRSGKLAKTQSYTQPISYSKSPLPYEERSNPTRDFRLIFTIITIILVTIAVITVAITPFD